MSNTGAPPQRRKVSVVAPPTTAASLRAAIAAEPRLELVAAAERFVDLVRAKEFPGDVVLLVEPAGAPLLAHARTAITAGAAVVVHSDADHGLRESLETAGAVIVTEGASPAEVARSCAGVDRAARRRRPRAIDPADRRPRLSHSERRALAHYVQGHSTVQVAAEMGVGYETAKTFLRRVRAKYAALDRPAGKRAELISRAEEDGIL
ncbi:helix-turn-helix transcriptional regulator [Agrococcus sp. TSP3-2-1]|uniref:helix-turn-helix transcriptional regulator n=1 Tax=Agrococcus sp. TSP3-2-1 TaxID=2804583 RepID=UPI003CEA8A0E